MTDLSVEERVQNGVDWLDAVNPEWWTKIDLEQLELFHPCKCVLGQLFTDNDYDQSKNFDEFSGYHRVRRLIIEQVLKDDFRSFEWMLNHGFITATEDEWWEPLEEEWIRQIKTHAEIGIIS